jgi:uncharacterized membrane protein YedE/YeeE
MANILRMPRWSPYVVGAGIGVLSWVTFYFMDKALGTSTSMVGAAMAVVGTVAPEHAAANEYYIKEYFNAKANSGAGAWKPVIDWQMTLVLFLIVGSALAAWLGRSWERGGGAAVPERWVTRFGPSRWLRYSAAFVGGVILIFGARMAGGCTSGHGISGGLQLAVSSWTFFVAMFGAGVVTAMALYGRAGQAESRQGVFVDEGSTGGANHV